MALSLPQHISLHSDVDTQKKLLNKEAIYTITCPRGALTVPQRKKNFVGFFINYSTGVLQNKILLNCFIQPSSLTSLKVFTIHLYNKVHHVHDRKYCYCRIGETAILK